MQGRYYDPETGRFLNADDVDFLGATGTQLSYNAFAYCENDVVNKVDPSGKVAMLTCVLIGAGVGLIVGGGIGALVSYLNYDKVLWKYVLVGGIFGVAIGATAGFGMGVAMGATPVTTFGLSAQATNLANNVGKLKFSKTIRKYIKTRKYYKYNSLIKEIIKSATPIKDGKNALKWVVPGTMNGTKGSWELVINPAKKIIYHFLFNSKRR